MKNNKILEEAAQWILKIQTAPLNLVEQQQFEKWRDQSIEHQLVWTKAELLLNGLKHFPEQSVDILSEGRPKVQHKFVGKFALVFCILFAGGILYSSDVKYQFLADYVRHIEKPQQIKLDDGTQVHLNVKTAIDVNYSKQQRQLVVHYGEVLIETAKEHQLHKRPFIVKTPHADIQALGTVFNVKLSKNKASLSCVGVSESAVKITLHKNKQSQLLHVGEQICFDAQHFSVKQPLNNNMFVWKNGMLLAHEMPLQQLFSEVSRYHHHYVRIDKKIRQLKVSGSYPLHDMPALLSAVSLSYPVQVKSYFNHHVIDVVLKEQAK